MLLSERKKASRRVVGKERTRISQRVYIVSLFAAAVIRVRPIVRIDFPLCVLWMEICGALVRSSQPIDTTRFFFL